MARTAKANEPRAITAAATRIKLSDKRLVSKQAARRQAWQEDAWEYFDLIGFVKQSMWLLGNAIAKTRLFIAVENPDDPDGDPIPASDPSSGVPTEVAAQAEFELARLKGPVGGLSEILRELDMNLEVAGEGYLIGLGPRPEVVDPRTQEVKADAQPESWTIRSTSEVEVTAGGVMKVADDPNATTRGKQTLDPELDTAIRFWVRHPRWSNLPDSSMRGELEDMETFLILTRQRRAEGKSRLPSGLLLISGDVTVASTVATEQSEGDNATATGDVVLDKIADAIADAIEDESAAAGLAPVTLRVPTAPNEPVSNKVARLDLSRTSEAYLDTRIDKVVESIARGINLPVESTMGHQQTTFANAEQIDEDKFYDHIEPRLLLIVDLLTVAFLRPQLVAPDEHGTQAGAQFHEWAPRLFTWYDPSALLSKPDTGANADGAYDRNEISGAAYRAAKGYSEDDAPDALELLIRVALRRGTLTDQVTKTLLEMMGTPIDVDEAEPIVEGEPAPVEEEEAETTVRQLATLLFMRDEQRRRSRAGQLAHAEPIPARSTPTLAAPTPAPRALTRAPESNPGRRLMELDRELRTRILADASTAMDRALERAGNRAQNKLPETRSLTRRMNGLQVLRTLGPGIIAAGGVTDDELLADSFDDLERLFMDLTGRAQQQAIDIAASLGTGFTTEQRGAYQMRQAADLEEAWAWLKEQMVTLAKVRMFEPAATAVLGEFDPSLSVPASMIRQSITRAGGTIGIQTSGAGDAWVSLADAGDRPAGGIGTGELIREALVTVQGATIEAYRWVYGPAMRAQPFEPHVDLDGEVFVNFDDEVLANDEGWPPMAFFMPGDHDGCLCDLEPIVLTVSDDERSIVDSDELA